MALKLPRKSFAWLTPFVLLIFAVSALAQSEKPVSPAEQLVKLNVIVTDRSDRAVEDVRKEDLQLLEDGAAQIITYFGRDERPVTCGFVIDASGSVRRILPELIDSAKLAAAGLRDRDEGFVARFVDTFQIKQEMTTDREAITDTLDDIYVQGGQTAFLDAVEKSLQYLEDNQSGDANSRRQILVLVTDGEDRGKTKDSKTILTRVRQSKVQIFVLALTKVSSLQSSAKKAVGLLNDFAEQSGGRAFFPESSSALPDAAREIARDLHTQFVVGYAAGNKSMTERRIQAKWIGRGDQGNRKVITRPIVIGK
jgi:Ca-activated chloride channel family protein